MSTLFVEQNLNRAKSLISKGEVLEAFHIYDKIIKKFPNNERAKLAIKKLQPPQVKINTTLEYFQKGQYEQAEVLAKCLTKNFPRHPFGWQVLGAIFIQTKRIKESIFPFEQNLLINPQDAVANNNLGNALRELGEYKKAEKLLRQAISINFEYASAHNNLGATLIELGKLEEAEIFLKKAILLRQNFLEGHINLGKMLYKLNRLNEAEEHFRKAILLKPDHFETYNSLGVTLNKLNKLKEAETFFKKSISLNPRYADAYNNLGNTFKEMGRFEEAVINYQHSIRLKFEFPEAHNNLGMVFKELNNLDESEKSLRQAIKIKNNFAEAYNNLGDTLREKERYDEAEVSYQQALKFKPDYANAYSNLGILYHHRGLSKMSINCYSKAIYLDPNNVSYKWDFTIKQLSKVYENNEDYKESLNRFDFELSKLDKFITSENIDEAAKFVGKSFPYYLAYHENDNKDLLEKHGKICHRIMKHWQEKQSISKNNEVITKKISKKIKIGIISSHIHYHSVWNAFLKGIIKNLNTEKFELYIFSLGKNFDQETNIAKNIVKYFYFKEGGTSQWANKIIDCKIDIAFYPEIGMNKQTIQLASIRLAPVQVCSWGHPETSGLPTIDYYISSDLLETKTSHKFYTEKLIKLPGLGYYFEPPTLEISQINFSDMNINQDSPILLCLGQPNKFSPFYDWVFIQILRRIKNCQLIFMHDLYGASQALKKRLKSLVEKAGFIFEKHIVFIPQQSRIGFSTLMKNSDILLDTLGFSGMNTAMQAIGCGLPVVTKKGKFQRTRHASAILKTINLEELITTSEEEYINLVEKVILDQEFKKTIRKKIKHNENLLYRNKDAILALEDFFQNIGNVK